MTSNRVIAQYGYEEVFRVLGRYLDGLRLTTIVLTELPDRVLLKGEAIVFDAWGTHAVRQSRFIGNDELQQRIVQAQHQRREPESDAKPGKRPRWFRG